MSTQSISSARLSFSLNQYLYYVVLGIFIWITGVVIIRIIGPSFFVVENSLLFSLFIASIPLGFAVQFSIPTLIRLPMKDTLIPGLVIVIAAIISDGLAITYTDIYSSDISTKMVVGGWLLWTFGFQLLITLIIVNIANSSKN